MQSLLLRLLKPLLGKLVNEETLKQFAEYLRRMAYRAVDVAIAALLAYLVQVLNAPDDGGDVILAMGLPIGNENIDPTTNLVGSFAVVTLVRYILPIVLRLLGAFFLPAFVALVALSLPASSLALEITGPTSTPAGKPPIVRLTAKIEDGSRCIFLAFPMDNIDIEANGTECQIVGVPGAKHTIVVVELRKDGTNPPQSQISTTIEFGGTPTPTPPTPTPPAPTPPTPPTPTPPTPPTPPNPTPVVPDGAFGLTKWAYGYTAGMPASDRSHAPAVANFFRGAAEQLQNGQPITATLTDRPVSYPSNPNGFQKAISDYLDTFGGGWVAFKSALGAELRKPAFTKRPADYVAAGVAVADGVGAAK